MFKAPPKIDFLLDEFSANFDTIIESLPTFPIPFEGSDSLREEIDIFPGPNDSIPPGIESDDDVVEDIPVDVPNILPTHPALQLDFDCIPSNDLGSDLDDSSPSGDRNKIYDPGICIEVESTRFLSTLSPVIDTLLPFSFENEDKVFNHGVLAYKEKSPPSSSHRGLKAFQLSPESPMLIHGDNTPNLGDFPDCDDSRARGFVLRSLGLHILSFIWEIRYPNLIDQRFSLSILNKWLRIYVETLRKTLRTMFHSSMGGSIDVIMPAAVVFTYRIFTKGRKTKPNRTKPSTDLKRARKTEAKGAKGLKTELKRKFPDRLDNVCAFNEAKTKSKSTPGYGFGKSMEKQTRIVKSGPTHAGVSLVLQIDNTLPLVEKVDSEATEIACTLKSMAIRDRTGNIGSFAFQKPKTSKPANSWGSRWEIKSSLTYLSYSELVKRSILARLLGFSFNLFSKLVIGLPEYDIEEEAALVD
ncbi:hypothetical protein Tco_0749207 [Tanacetum coccineum]|uniref:Uncharacterized protein n=1 Tax=Tanacetum coccineum TaxID=301880 RepID=A0ABQ4Z0A7_9ASTR